MNVSNSSRCNGPCIGTCRRDQTHGEVGVHRTHQPTEPREERIRGDINGRRVAKDADTSLIFRARSRDRGIVTARALLGPVRRQPDDPHSTDTVSNVTLLTSVLFGRRTSTATMY